MFTTCFHWMLASSRSPHGERGLKLMREWIEPPDVESLSSRRAWIEIPIPSRRWSKTARRSPHGERGLKWIDYVAETGRLASLSSRRAWIEISRRRTSGHAPTRRSPHGERGLKYHLHVHGVEPIPGRSPHGERGLKLRVGDRLVSGLDVALLTESVD